jgi:hypothetical protein
MGSHSLANMGGQIGNQSASRNRSQRAAMFLAQGEQFS